MKKEFGFYPDPLEITAGPVTISMLPELGRKVDDVLSSDYVEDDWVYAPPRRFHDLVSGEVRESPYSSRVFPLPKTHIVEHAGATSEDHLRFHIWALSFFLGIRLTTEQAGFLDATPIRPGKLKRFDFFLAPSDYARAIQLAEDFWMQNLTHPLRARRFEAAVQALLLAENPLNLQFERFVYLYAAVDTCYALAKDLRQLKKDIPHGKRIEWMCSKFNMKTPAWADPATSGGVEVAKIRNCTLHEALFMDAPLGFAIHQGSPNTPNLILEMAALVCRLLVALIGGRGSHYVQSPTNTRQRHLLRLI